ncbi:transcription initiation factor TFIID subunit 4-like isoform X2 [Panthera leo]|nr:transcription initiation factor TFIID subunit 4-like isoform X2 [Panthera leo]XP_042809683.1 transcription initiation factor TFIID subunit 4-like isoform X2 [Panthera leo]XP_042809685.1 transcription initiation factor TFIID subunit 4-like isoform X2 [Panthera leo]
MLKAPLKVAVVTPSLTTSLFGRLQGSPPKNHSKRQISLELVGRGPPVSGFKAAQAGARGTPFAQRTRKRRRSAGRAAGQRRANGLAEEERAPDVCPGAPRPGGGHPAFGAVPEARLLRAPGFRPPGRGRTGSFAGAASGARLFPGPWAVQAKSAGPIVVAEMPLLGVRAGGPAACPVSVV